MVAGAITPRKEANYGSVDMKAAPLTVGEITAKPGEIATGYIEVAKKFDATWYTLTIIIVNGVEAGENLLITAGVHGNETPGPVALIQEIPKLDPSQMKGAVICVPVVNIEAFEIKRRENLIDCVDMNRASPGSLDKRLTHKRLYFIYAKIKESVLPVFLQYGRTYDQFFPR